MLYNNKRAYRCLKFKLNFRVLWFITSGLSSFSNNKLNLTFNFDIVNKLCK